MRRSRRDGLLERKVYSKMGLFPWRCTDCKARVMHRNSGKWAFDKHVRIEEYFARLAANIRED